MDEFHARVSRKIFLAGEHTVHGSPSSTSSPYQVSPFL
jgi:hypothetical protein